MKNTLTDMYNILFEELERLNDEELTGDDLSQEIKRAQAMSGVAQQAVSATTVVVQAAKVMGDSLRGDMRLPKYIGLEEK